MWSKPSSSAKRKKKRKYLICDFSQTPEPTVLLKAKSCLNFCPFTGIVRTAFLKRVCKSKDANPLQRSTKISWALSQFSRFPSLTTWMSEGNLELNCTRYLLAGELASTQTRPSKPSAVDDRSTSYINCKPYLQLLDLLKNTEAWRYILKQLLEKKEKKIFASVCCSHVLPSNPFLSEKSNKKSAQGYIEVFFAPRAQNIS